MKRKKREEEEVEEKNLTRKVFRKSLRKKIQI